MKTDKNVRSQKIKLQTNKPKAKLWRKILTIFTFLAMVGLIYFSRNDIYKTFINIKTINYWILIFMVVWQVLNYHCYARMYQAMFKTLNSVIRYKSMAKVSMELNFVNHVFPSAGIAGFSYFSFRMKQLGVAISKSTLVQMMRFVMIFLSFQILLLIGVLILASSGKANNFTILVASSLGTFLAVGTALAAYIVGDKRRIDKFTVGLAKFLNTLLHWVRPNHPETINIEGVQKLFLELHEDYLILVKKINDLKKPFIYAFFANLTEVLTVYTVYVAFGQPVNFGAVILAYAVANFAGLISILPGGIGVYEALMTAVLAASGVPLSIAAPATIMYRILSMAIQLPIGYYYYQKAIKKIDV